MKGVIMAGGRASRLGGGREKALLEIGGKTLLCRAAEALRVDGIDDVIVAVTKNSPRTCEQAMKMQLGAIQTNSGDYHGDTIELLNAFGPFISLNVDIPFIEPMHISKLLANADSLSLAAVVPLSIAIRAPDKDSVGDDGRGRQVIWIGLNFVTPNPQTSVLYYDDPLLSVNVNTEQDLAFARRLANSER